MRTLRLSLAAMVILVLLVVQVTAAAESEGEAVGDAVEPVHFTAVLSPSGGRHDREVTHGEGYVRTTCLTIPIGVYESSDLRFDGTGSWRGTTDRYRANPSFALGQGAYRIENDGGAWQQVPTTALTLRVSDRLPVVLVFEGEGAYAGLTVVAQASFAPNQGRQLDGVIFEGEIPPLPDPVEPTE